MSGYIALKDFKILALLSGGYCALPDCNKALAQEATPFDDAVVLGEAAHIHGEKEGAARYDASLARSYVQSYKNLLYLCGDCHNKIDKQSQTYTVPLLHKIKKDHELRIKEVYREEMINIGFAELDVITSAILSNPGNPVTNFTATPPKKKMAKNGLSSDLVPYFQIGYGKAPEVEEFIQSMAVLDPAFPERLKSGFVSEYERLSQFGITGDDLFDSLLKFATKGRHQLRYSAAGLAILVYYFRKCEVFIP